MIKPLLTLLLSLAGLAGLPLHAATVADSQDDFDSAGEQGTNGWSYGYRLVDAGDDRENYDAQDDFILFDEADGWVWDGTKWDWGDGNVPWTEVGASSGHPNGTNHNEEHWVIRRWEVNLPNEAPLALTWHLHKDNANGGNGTSGSLHLNGERIDFASVAGTDDVGFDRTVYVNAKPGDFIDFALLPEGEDGNPIDGSDGSSFWITLDDEIPGNPVQPDGTPFAPVNAADDDGDGIPDGYELSLFPGDLDALSADGDHDGDGVQDAEEFQSGLDPTNPDSDSDGFSDGEEIAAETDPRNAAINPWIVADSIEDWDIDGEHDPEGWSSGYRDLSLDSGEVDYEPGDFIPFSEDEGWVWNGAAWDWGDGNVPWTTVAAESTHPNGDNNGAIHWTVRRWAPQVEEPTPFALIWSMRKQNVDCGNGVTGSLHINGEQVDTATIARSDGDGVTRTFYATVFPNDLIDLALTPEGEDKINNDGCDGSLFSLKISRGIPTPALQPDGSTVYVPPGAGDSDGDQLADVWEFSYFSDDLTQLSGGADFDGDGSTDDQELERNTDPTEPDSDGDGLTDGVETDTGIFVSADDTGSDPRNVDSDRDGLSDFQEVTGDPASDPNKRNTDGDASDDFQELACGSDPNDPNDHCKVGLIADSEADWSSDGVQGENSWFYGYRNLTAEGDVERVDYDPTADFIPYPQDWWTGTTWDFPDGDVPWTSTGPSNTHPNGDNNGEVHWTVRRWEANVDIPTAVAIRWLTAKENIGCGNGVTGAIHVNGVRIDSNTIEVSDGEGEERTVYANVEFGDTIDLINSPLGTDETNADGCDGTLNGMTIGTNLPEKPLQPDGTPFDPVVLGDPSLSFSRRSPFGQLGETPGEQTRTVSLTNPGDTQDLVISEALLTGPESDHYSIDLTLPLTIAPGETHEFDVTFDPQDTDGGFIAYLDFTSNDENLPMRRLDLNANIPDRNKLVAWYKLDETEGTRMNDSSGNGLHGTFLDNGATLDLGQPGLAGGNSVRFAPDGATAAYAEVPNFPIFEGGFTLSLWFQADPTLDPVAGLVSKNDGPDANGRPFALASAENRLNWFGDGVPDIEGGEASALVPNQTQHVLVTYDPAAPTVTIYVDGAQTEFPLEGASSILDVVAPLQIGAVNGNFGFNGLLDDVQFYGRVLNTEEVTWLTDNPGMKLGQTDDPDPNPTLGDAAIAGLSLTETGITFDLSGVPAGGLNVEYSQDLTTWEVIATSVGGDTHQDTDATRTGRASGYYRLAE